METAINNCKAKVREHIATSFSVDDIFCNRDEIIILNQFKVKHCKPIMDALGIRKNLSDDIFTKPSENWGVIQAALKGVNSQKRIGVIVNARNEVVTLINIPPPEPTALNYDERIDDLADLILNNSNREIKSVNFTDDCSVTFEVANQSQIDVGQGDMWQFGTSVGIGYTSQQFSNYFLRLVCANGMMTKENMMYRKVRGTAGIGKQFEKFASDERFAEKLVPRVAALKESRSSFYEINSIASQLTHDQQEIFMPEYGKVIDHHRDNGYNLLEMGAAKQRMTYTDQNLYDVFNIGTNLASHQREVLGQDTCKRINKAASDIFVKVPNLSFEVLDIYKN